MLAQNFKTPADLQISDIEFDALRNVLGMLERGEIDGKLDMWEPSPANECQTPACICGWARRIERRPIFIRGGDYRPPQLRNLFWMGSDDETCAAITKAKAGAPADTGAAAVALRNFLTHGEPRWAEALSG